MTLARIYLAPASAGKTAFALERAREAAQKLEGEIRVCVSGRQQVRSCRRRLAMSGGVLGVRVITFDQLYKECLSAAGQSYTLLRESAQYRLMRAVASSANLTFYKTLTEKPGFIQLLLAFVADMKAARIWPEEFLKSAEAIGNAPRLRELGLIYEAYQARLRQEEWADNAGLGWLAVEMLETPDSALANSWPLLIVDGFDSFTEVQLALLGALAGQVRELVVTLTGATGDGQERPVFRRFRKTCERLEKALGGTAEPLPEQYGQLSPPLSHLEAWLFDGDAQRREAAGGVELLQAPNQATEAREALRWLKERLVRDGMRPTEVALLARDMAPYRSFVLQAAQEFGLPVRLSDGLPLRDSPVIVALLELLRLVLPQEGGEEESDSVALQRKGVVAAWRSPYFDWANTYENESAARDPEARPIGITPADAEALDAVARWGRVIGGRAQWEHVFRALTGRASRRKLDDEQDLPDNVAIGQEAQVLQEKFQRFLARISPPAGQQRYKALVSWLEDMIGGDPYVAAGKEVPLSLHVAERAYDEKTPLAGMEIAALNALKEALRGLIWVEEQVGGDELIKFSQFYAELSAAVEVATYEPPLVPDREEILVAQVLCARGLPFRAVVVLGMAEGSFPATLAEDLFLPEADRDRLRKEHGLRVDPAIESAEREFFYEAITAPSEKLLLTRPDLADSGAEWPPSPFWEEIQRLLPAEPVKLKTDTLTPPERAASRAELIESLAGRAASPEAQSWLQEVDPGRWQRLLEAGRIFGYRYAVAASKYDGDLADLDETFAGHFAAAYRWSPSSLENYLGCPYRFFVGKVLGLEPRVEPAEGLDARQLGSIYHEILEALYYRLPEADRNDPQKLLNALPGIAGPVLDRAPGRQGFRETAWWQETRNEIVQNIARSVQALASMADEFTPFRFEAGFFGEESLIVRDGEDSFRLHGVIDRVDRDPAGQIRVIDYKTAGPYSYGKHALEQGEKLQLPLYALAAQDALGLGRPADGFYWHIRQAEASGLRLADYGPEEAIETALAYAWRAVGGARQGQFGPTPPGDGCPSFCPAVDFCWHYRGRR